MQRIMLPVLAALLTVYSCTKDKHARLPTTGTASIAFELDGVPITRAFPDNKNHPCSTYSFGGFSGFYFGIVSTYEISSRSDVTIALGTAKTKNTYLTEEEFVQLIAPSERKFGSLGAFTSFPQLKSDRVEISMTDENGARWSTTKISEKETLHGIQAFVVVNQPEGVFIIEEIMKSPMVENSFSYQVRGKFDCLLYKVNSNDCKSLKGSFTAVMRGS